jgi:hypothetical protein
MILFRRSGKVSISEIPPGLADKFP